MKISVTVDALHLRTVGDLVRVFTSNNDLENYIKRGRSLAQTIVIVESYEENFDFGIEFKKFLDSFGLSISDVVFTGGVPLEEILEIHDVSVHFDHRSDVASSINRAYPGRVFLTNFSA